MLLSLDGKQWNSDSNSKRYVSFEPLRNCLTRDETNRLGCNTDAGSKELGDSHRGRKIYSYFGCKSWSQSQPLLIKFILVGQGRPLVHTFYFFMLRSLLLYHFSVLNYSNKDCYRMPFLTFLTIFYLRFLHKAKINSLILSN